MSLISRFIRSSKQFSISNNRVKPSAFLPMYNQNSLRYETSVFFIDDLCEEQVWSLGYLHIGDTIVKARADVEKNKMKPYKISVDFDNVPKRHANIVNWPEGKDEQKLIALQIAQIASLKTP